MKTTFKSISFCGAFLMLAAIGANAQSYNWISSTEGDVWQQLATGKNQSPK